MAGTGWEDISDRVTDRCVRNTRLYIVLSDQKDNENGVNYADVIIWSLWLFNWSFFLDIDEYFERKPKTKHFFVFVYGETQMKIQNSLIESYPKKLSDIVFVIFPLIRTWKNTKMLGKPNCTLDINFASIKGICLSRIKSPKSHPWMKFAERINLDQSFLLVKKQFFF